jgi:Zn-dependent peptidase ImmA (M78 family)
MNFNKEIVRRAAIEALKVRSEYGIKLWQAICIYDLAEEKLGLRIHFDDIPSMEGTYINDLPPTIILSSLRPTGRMAFNCAHEIGHHQFGHGTRVDELVKSDHRKKYNPEEFLADCFAAFLLMPKIAVRHGFAKREWDISSCTPEQLYVVAGWLGVGYTTLVKHMCYSLYLLSSKQAQKLCKTSPKKIRETIICGEAKGNLFVVGREWSDRPIDIQVGDLVMFREEMLFDGKCIQACSHLQVDGVFKGVCPGIGRFYSSDRKWAEFVRVSRTEYKGRCIYRHLEDTDYE